MRSPHRTKYVVAPRRLAGLTILVVMALALSRPPAALAANNWVDTGSLKKSRIYHTASLLGDGTVLVAGGQNAGTSCEFYYPDPGGDPTKGGWVERSPLNTARYNHTAIVLPDGKVLVAGGYTAGKSAEIYNPATETWTPTGSLQQSRHNHTATLLNNGKVLVVGGDSSPMTAELYDPTTGQWTTTQGGLRSDHQYHSATLLTDGRVLVAGGYPAGVACEIYNPATDSWDTTGPLPTSRSYHTANLLPNGQVLVTGGIDAAYHGMASSELYNPGTGTWSTSGSLSVPHYYHTATRLPNGRVLVAGGHYNSGYITIYPAAAEIYDYNISQWEITSALNHPRDSHTATLMAKGWVLVAGGTNGTECEIYDAGTPTWTPARVLSVPQVDHTATLLRNGMVLVAGGWGYNSDIYSQRFSLCELYHPSSGTWTTTSFLIQGRYSHTATLLADGRVLAAGGYGQWEEGGVQHYASLNECEFYDPNTGYWTGAALLNHPRSSHTATLLRDGKVLVAGGGWSGAQSLPRSCELFDPTQGTYGTWTETGLLNAGTAAGHTATLLADGQVLVAGGSGVIGETGNSAELYDPATATWTLTGSLKQGRAGHTATLLRNGKVLVTGGSPTGITIISPITSAEIYDPVSKTWTTTSSLNIGRANHTATLLPNGQVLVAGGLGRDPYLNVILNSAEVYNPATGTWTITDFLNTPRCDHKAILLANGQVMAIGGYNSYDNPTMEFTSYTNSVEFYLRALGSTGIPPVLSLLLLQ